MNSSLRIARLTSFHPLVLLALSATGLAASGCESQSCTLIGCHDGLIVDLSHRLVEGDYRVTVTSPDEVAQCDIRVTADSNLEAFSCDSETVHLHPQWFALSTHPESVEISITRVETDVNVTEQFEADYEKHSPNGDQCGPVCNVATVEFDTSALFDPHGGGGAGGTGE